MDASGNLYGTTFGGGASGCGTVFELVNSSGTYSEKVLYSFASSSGDACSPQAGLIVDASGNLYGTTNHGGSKCYGTVFELANSSGTYTEKVLYSFTNSSGDGANTLAGLIMDASDNLYGTTYGGGAGGHGTAFELVNSSGTYSEKVLYSFTGGDGSNPQAGLIKDSSGNLYGTTSYGGGSGDCACGVRTLLLVLNAPAKEVKICVRRLSRSLGITRKTIRDKTFLLPVASVLGDPRRKIAVSHVRSFG
jgi:uncharacterized repeat protein (TIGR03803 family)